MKKLLLTVTVFAALLSTSGCKDTRNDSTGRGEKQDRLDTTTGKAPDRGR